MNSGGIVFCPFHCGKTETDCQTDHVGLFWSHYEDLVRWTRNEQRVKALKK